MDRLHPMRLDQVAFGRGYGDHRVGDAGQRDLLRRQVLRLRLGDRIARQCVPDQCPAREHRFRVVDHLRRAQQVEVGPDGRLECGHVVRAADQDGVVEAPPFLQMRAQLRHRPVGYHLDGAVHRAADAGPGLLEQAGGVERHGRPGRRQLVQQPVGPGMARAQLLAGNAVLDHQDAFAAEAGRPGRKRNAGRRRALVPQPAGMALGEDRVIAALQVQRLLGGLGAAELIVQDPRSPGRTLRGGRLPTGAGSNRPPHNTLGRSGGRSRTSARTGAAVSTGRRRSRSPRRAGT